MKTLNTSYSPFFFVTFYSCHDENSLLGMSTLKGQYEQAIEAYDDF
jgi:hypothetical protein